MINQTVEDVEKQFLRRRINDIEKEVRTAISGRPCQYCNEPVSLCKSHSVPRSFLANISENGHVRTFNSMTEVIGIDTEDGVGKAGTFKMICGKCDGTIFHTYENEENYDRSPPSQRILAEIAMKNYLKLIYKRLLEQERQKRIKQHGYLYYMEEVHDFDIYSYDLQWYTSHFEITKARAKEEQEGTANYEIVYYKKLDYIISLASQTDIVLQFDFKGNVVCDVYCGDTSYEIWELHLCVFPFKDSSIVLLFIDKEGINQYQTFINQFNTYSDSDKLAIINYLLFLYSENIFLSKDIPDDIIHSSELQRVAGIGVYDILQISSLNRLKKHSEIIRDNRVKYNLKKFNEIPNLLSEKYKIKEKN